MRLTALLLLAVAGAAPSPVDLRWEAPVGCPSHRELLAEIDRLLGEAGPGDPGMRHISAVAQVREELGRWSAHLETSSDGLTGERTLWADDCAGLAQATALVLALALRPAPPSLEGPSPPPRRLSWALGLGAIGDVGSLALPAFGGGLTVGLESGPFAVEAFVARTVAQRVSRGPRATSALELQGLLGLGLRGCWRPLGGRVTLGPCVGIDGWLLEGRAYEVTVPSSGRGWWLGPVAAVEGGVRLDDRVRVRLWASLEVAVPVVRPAFLITGYGVVHESSLVAGRLRAGLELGLW